MFQAVALATCLFSIAMTPSQPEKFKWTTIKGRIIWDKNRGQVPERIPIKLTNDREEASKGPDLLTEDWIVDPDSLGIKNVVIWLAPEPTESELNELKRNRNKQFASFKSEDVHPDLRQISKKPHEITGPFCKFTPHIVLAREGESLLLVNNSTVANNVKWDTLKNGSRNLLLKPSAQTMLANLKLEKQPILFSSSIHPWMEAYLRVFDHPYFALTNAKGEFEIKNVPVMDGKLRLYIWQERNGYHRGGQGRLGSTIDVKKGTVDLGKIELKGQD